MPVAGLIGGIAPASTVDYYQRIIAAYRQRATDDSYPNLVINSINLRKLLSFVESGRLAELAAYLLTELDRLAKAGADFALFTSNTPHIVLDGIRRQSPLPLVSIVEAARDAAVRAGYSRVGLLGTRFTMGGSFYQSAFAAAGITVVPPRDDEQVAVHRKYMGELIDADYRPATRDEFLAIVERMHARDAVQAVLLAGTELPLLLRDTPSACPFIDTTAIHVEKIVARLLPGAAAAERYADV